MDAEKKGSDVLQLISFRTGAVEFAIGIMSVLEVIRMQEVARMPGMPEYVEGVFNLRGNVIPLIDLRKRFGLKPAVRDRENRIIVVSSAGRTSGLIVDSVGGIAMTAEGHVEPPPSSDFSGIPREYVSGIGRMGERLFLLLNIGRILSFDERLEPGSRLGAKPLSIIK